MYQFCDPFDNYTDITSYWEAVVGTNTISSSFARFAPPAGLNGMGLKVPQGASTRKNLPNNIATPIFGVAFYTSSLSVITGTTDYAFHLLDNGTVQVSVQFTSSGAIQVYRGLASALLGATSPGLLAPASWYFIEFVGTINSATGAAAIYVSQPGAGGVASLSLSGVNTQASANAYINQIQLAAANYGGVFHYYDDLYVFDTTGTTQNARLGDQRLIYKTTNGAGASTQFTPNGNPNNWQNVNIVPPPGDTDYNSSGTPGQTDLFALQSAGLTANPNFFVTRRNRRKDDAGARTDQSIVRSGGVNATSAAAAVNSTYGFQDDIFVNDPATGSPWLAAAADAAQAGYVETS